MCLHYAAAEGGFISAAKSKSLPAEKIGEKKQNIFYSLSAERTVKLTDPERI